ncbi:penicillin-binding transpeptidase domain-containing protein [Phytohabitans rumicis]|nr:penicillin-binding transpeptidase domain-containing protein [Phytohabitans rumicis]
MRSTYGVMSVVLAAGVLTACSSGDGPDKSVDAFLSGWRSGKLDAVGFVDPVGAKIPAADVTAQIRALSGELVDNPPALKRDGEPKVTEDIATSTVTVDWTLPGGAHWTYPTTVRMSKGKDDAWQVIWEPKVVHEQLTSGDSFAIRRETAERATILDGAGQPIVESRAVVTIGVEPQAISEAAALTKDLGAAFKSVGVDAGLSDLPARIKAAKPDAFVEIITLRENVYLKIRQRLQDMPGTRFRKEQRQLAPTREFARALLGTVDPVLREDIDKNPDKFVVGDLIGHGGLQGKYDDRLRGTTGQTVVITRKGPEKTEDVAEAFRSEPKPGAPLKTTLDQKVQLAADNALKGNPRRTALVAVRISDGAVLAAANGPNGGGDNLAFTASVPPGSTFKMISALALLDKGAVSLDGKVDCPKTATVDGRSFKNSHNMALGSVPFRVDFAKSCNTAFIGLAPKLGDDGLAVAGRSVGLEGAWDLGVNAFSGKVSTGGSAAEQAAAAFGQGTTVVSPLAMAAATAAVARGQWQQPKVLLDPAPAAPAAAGPQLNAASVEALRTMMREVVTNGTASALSDVPGKPVYGKTGTAEYDNNPENTHAWWVGWQDDIAFAVFVEKGGSSTTASVPIAEKFLRGLS